MERKDAAPRPETSAPNLPTEIERKFLLSGFPDALPLTQECRVEQFYLSVEPEVRLRAEYRGDRCFCTETVKSSGLLCRNEIQTAVDRKFYDAALALVGKPPIRKDYRRYRLRGGLTLEVSLVDEAFYYGEVEFPDAAAAAAWTAPEALGPALLREVTEEAAFKMKNYWKRTRCAEEKQ